MSIQKSPDKIKAQSSDMPIETYSLDSSGRIEDRSLIKKYFLALVLVLSSILSFGIGKLSTEGQKHNMTISYDPSLSGLVEEIATTPKAITSNKPNIGSSQTATAENSIPTLPTEGQVVASKKGTKYHYPYCPGAKTIAPQNKITFNSVEEAMKAGYTLAANCKVR